ncbi:MAG: flippase, partial [Patescibacteria group bacterium]|nr:flippase [Patescibacteria group bacterium]
MSYSRKVFLGTLAQFISQAISVLVGIVSVSILTRYLGPTGYGYFNTTLVFVSFLSVLGDMGVQAILARELSQNPEEKQKIKILGNVFVWRIISIFIMFFFIASISRFMPYAPLVKILILIEGARASIALLRGFFITLPQVKMRLDLSAWGTIILRLSYLLSVVAVFYFDLGITVLFFLMAICSLLDIIYLYFAFKRLGGVIKLQFDLKFIKAFLRESLVLGFASVLGTIHYQIDTIILSVIKPAYDVGIYGAAYNVFTNIIVVPGIFMNTIFPRYAELAHNRKSWIKFFDFSLFLLWLLALPIALFIFMFAPYIIKIVGGGQFVNSVLPLQILSFALIGAFAFTPFVYMAIALRRQKQIIFVAAIAVIVNVALNLILIPRYTYVGAATATLVSETLSFLVFAFVFFKYLKFKINFFLWLKALLPALLLLIFWIALKLVLPLDFFITQS